MPVHPIITFTSDFGNREPYVAAVKGSILTAYPDARIVDLSHDVSSHDLLEASYFLACTYPYFPLRTIHLVVVDPTVGSNRRGIIALTDDAVFVAPDNGVLSLVVLKSEPTMVVSIEAEHYYRRPVSPTFHGRDIFGPVVGWLAKGTDIEHFGPVIKDYARFALPPVRKVADNRVEGIVLHIDKFGNVITSITPEDCRKAIGRDTVPGVFRVAGKEITAHRRFYSESNVDELFSLVSSSGYYEIAAMKKPAARQMEVKRGMKVELEVR